MSRDAILETLRREHQEQRALLERLDHARSDAERSEAVGRLARLIRNHHDREEAAVVDALLAHPGARAVAKQAYEGHAKVERALADLAAHAGEADADVDRRELAAILRHHLREEERTLYPMAAYVIRGAGEA